ncbi:peptide-binding protein [Burkholderia sp. ABCPW 14]|uniref:peptide-binding protein n=1 Tax=Burkholderia sp. ABCPW 14 TaxID=1637860 RepID=UPI000770C440|nr:peptide-binding protein [Burkholderia sp. ABCPW 14]KVD74240.1 peptide-binding protein [Burkholderia sp. ABCPW 14]
MTTERAIRKIGQWAAGATCALAAALVFAQPPHGGGPGFGGGRGGAPYAAGGAGGWRGSMQAVPHGREARIGVNGYGQRWGLRPTPSYGRYAAQSPYRPISAEARQAPHAPGSANVPMRAGSIRADVARYNEERGGRPAPSPRQDEAPHLPSFAPFYRN